MKKKALALAISALMVTGIFTGCGSDEKAEGKMNVGMVTDSGTIDDKSFNQGSWEGIAKAEKEFGITEKYLQPDKESHADYMTKIKDLYDGGFKFIITPGFKFETALFEAQDKYSDAKFVLIDGTPNNGKDGSEKISKVGDNTVAIYFAEEQSGFMAGVAAALELKEGELGFIGGMEIPPVQKFNYGFQQGVAYANENLGTKMSLKEENITYQGTFNSADAGQQIAAAMYDRGVKAIFCSAGGTGTGAITEAKTRVQKGQNVWVIGVDSDQYKDGVYEGEKSVILTSAMKGVTSAAYEMIKEELNGSFPGGKTIVLDAKSDGVGLPTENPNLSKETIEKSNEVYNKIKNDEVKVSAEKGSLIK